AELLEHARGGRLRVARELAQREYAAGLALELEAVTFGFARERIEQVTKAAVFALRLHDVLRRALGRALDAVDIRHRPHRAAPARAGRGGRTTGAGRPARPSRPAGATAASGVVSAVPPPAPSPRASETSETPNAASGTASSGWFSVNAARAINCHGAKQRAPR